MDALARRGERRGHADDRSDRARGRRGRRAPRRPPRPPRARRAPVTVTVGMTPIVLAPEQVVDDDVRGSSTVAARAAHRPGEAPRRARPAARAPRGPAAGRRLRDRTAPRSSVIPALNGKLVNLDAVGPRDRRAATTRHRRARGRPAGPHDRVGAGAEHHRAGGELHDVPPVRAAPGEEHPEGGRRSSTARSSRRARRSRSTRRSARAPSTRATCRAPGIGADLEYEDSVGGGVSQLSTTLYNATFFGCYQDVTHSVHALYISRYPMGREATLNYPGDRQPVPQRLQLGCPHPARSTAPARSRSRSTATRAVAPARDEGPNVLRDDPVGARSTSTTPPCRVGQQKMIAEGHTGYVVENFRIISIPGPARQARAVRRAVRRPARRRSPAAPRRAAAATAATRSPPPAPRRTARPDPRAVTGSSRGARP